MRNLVYIQSGGPTSIINSSFYGAIKEAMLHKDKIDGIYGSLNGIDGLIFDNLIDIEKEDADQIELLKQTPGSILGTARRKLPKDIHDELYLKIIETLKKHDIKYVLVNGGNDSMDTCYKLSLLAEELKLDVKIIGIPKTIDNDLMGTDHSLGFPSAAKYLINSIHSMAKDITCFKKGKITIFEIMGRNAGWLTAAADLLEDETRPDLFYLPETGFDLQDFLTSVKKIYEQKGHAMVVMSEGVDFPRDGIGARVDAFGHVQLGGVASDLCRIVEKELDISTRAIEFSLNQRCSPYLISRVDQEEAIAVGQKAVQSLLQGQSGSMVIIKRVSDCPYRYILELASLAGVANAEKVMDSSYTYDETRMSDKFKDYLKPLIQGEINVKYVDGVIALSRFKYHKI